MVSRKKCLKEGLGSPPGIDDEIGAEAAGEAANCDDGVLSSGINGVRRAEPTSPLELPCDDIDGDHHPRTCDCGAGYGGVADTAASDDRHRVARHHGPRVRGGPV